MLRRIIRYDHQCVALLNSGVAIEAVRRGVAELDKGKPLPRDRDRWFEMMPRVRNCPVIAPRRQTTLAVTAPMPSNIASIRSPWASGNCRVNEPLMM